MPTVFTHALVGWGLARALRGRDEPLELHRPREQLAAGLAAAPDLDVIGFALGVRYQDLLGHRGLSHSLLCGAALGLLGWAALSGRETTPAGPVMGAAPRPAPATGPPGWLVLAALCLAACSHGLLDMLTDGGLGIALFAPFSAERLFFPVQPIPVSPIGAVGFLAHGLPVLLWEVALLWPAVGALWCVVRGLELRAEARTAAPDASDAPAPEAPLRAPAPATLPALRVALVGACLCLLALGLAWGARVG
ncbi:MAG: metal-dependent hydrolase [Planctomycetota bacterium]